MDPTWVAIIVGVVSSVITAGFIAAINFAALKAWMARREEREQSLGTHLGRMQDTVDRHEGVLGDHAVRIGVLEAKQG